VAGSRRASPVTMVSMRAIIKLVAAIAVAIT
jgi:hypothetical protein